MTKRSPFRCFKTGLEVIRLAVMMYIRFPLSLRNVEDLLHERVIEISHKAVRFWWNSFGPMFLAQDGGRGARAALYVDQWLAEWRKLDFRPIPSATCRCQYKAPTIRSQCCR
jgi:putative transposase